MKIKIALHFVHIYVYNTITNTFDWNCLIDSLIHHNYYKYYMEGDLK